MEGSEGVCLHFPVAKQKVKVERKKKKNVKVLSVILHVIRISEDEEKFSVLGTKRKLFKINHEIIQLVSLILVCHENFHS